MLVKIHIHICQVLEIFVAKKKTILTPVFIQIQKYFSFLILAIMMIYLTDMSEELKNTWYNFVRT